MNITFILPPLNLSGGIKVIAIYAKELVQRGHVVNIVSAASPNDSLRQKIKSKLLGREQPGKQKSFFDGSGLNHWIKSGPIRDTDVPNADIVIATWWETAEWVSAFSGKKGIKVYFIQGHEIFPFLPVERCHATYTLPMHKIVVSNWLKNIMLHEYGDTAVDVVPNGVDHSQFYADPRGRQKVPTAGLIYSTTPLKGLALSLSAIKKVRHSFPELKLVAFGNDRPTAQLPLPKDVEFSFSPPQDQIRSLLSRCDVWISASRSEGFNLPAMEAMACRTPVISTRTGWPADALRSGQNGFLVDADDEQNLVQAIKKVFSLSDISWKCLSDKAFETVKSSTWQSSATSFEAALRRALFRSSIGAA
jgi:glycosyltransferase involved in cell wall biosynthesis